MVNLRDVNTLSNSDNITYYDNEALLGPASGTVDVNYGPKEDSNGTISDDIQARNLYGNFFQDGNIDGAYQTAELTGITRTTEIGPDGERAVTKIDNSDYSGNSFQMLFDYTGLQLSAYFKIAENSDADAEYKMVNGVYTLITPADRVRLIDAIRDPLITVKLTPFFWYHTVAHGEESCQYQIEYFNGTSFETGNLESYSFKGNYNGPLNDSGIQLGRDFTVRSNDCSSANYVRLRLFNWRRNDTFNVTFVKIGLRVTCELKSNVTLETEIARETSGLSVISSTTQRDPLCDSTMVRNGDKIRIVTTAFYGGETYYDFETQKAIGVNDPDMTVGKYYRYLYLNTTTHKNMLTWTVPNTGAVVYEAKEVDSINNDGSAQIGVFTVTGRAEGTFEITASLVRRFGGSTGMSVTLTYKVDNALPTDPLLETDTLKTSGQFFDKYIKNKAYFTNKNMYVYEGNEVAKINLNIGGNVLVRPEFTEASLAIRPALTGAPQKIYYRVTAYRVVPAGTNPVPTGALTEIPRNPLGGQGFTIAQADGVYCTVDNSGVHYSDLFLPMPIYSGAYVKTAIFRIEFMAFDLVGNSAIGNLPYYLQVDVTDYQFSAERRLGAGVLDENGVLKPVIMDESVQFLYGTLDDANNVAWSSSQSPVFKRGDKVIIKASFSAEDYRRYILTSLSSLTGLYRDTTDYPYVAEGRINAELKEAGERYTFEVDSAFANNPQQRKLIFGFKERLIISVEGSTLDAVYTGKPQTVRASATLASNGEPQSVDIRVTYATDREFNHTVQQATDAGTYYVKCEVLTSQSYYGSAGLVGQSAVVLTIRPYAPNVLSGNMRAPSLNYGDSLSSIDFILNGTAQNPQTVNGAFLCRDLETGVFRPDRSADGVPGYFKIITPAVGNANYTKPPAGSRTVVVQFMPIQVERDGDGNIIGYKYTSNGLFIADNNYTSPTVTLTITVRYSESARLNITGIEDVYGAFLTSSSWDSAARTLSMPYQNGVGGFSPRFTVTSLLTAEAGEDLTKKVRYTYAAANELGEATSAFSVNFPLIAGNYLIKFEFRSNESDCNYEITSPELLQEWTVKLVITKLELTVTAQNAEYVYLYERNPVATARDGSTVKTVNFSYKYYYLQEGMTYQENLAYPVEAELLRNGIPFNAGKYLAEIRVNDSNFQSRENTCFAYLTILKADLITSDGKMSFTAPIINYYNREPYDGHITYLQTLSQCNIVTSASAGVVRYTFRDTNGSSYREQPKTLEGGAFYIVSRQKNANETIEDYIAAMNNEVPLVGNLNYYICYVPKDAIYFDDAGNARGNFRDNFELIYQRFTLVVKPARADFSQYSITPIVYGTRIFSIASLQFTGSVRIFLANNTYLTLDESDFTLSLSGVSSNPYPFGKYYIDVIFTYKKNAAGTNNTSFAVTTHAMELNVLAKELTINVSTGEGSGYNEITDAFEFFYKGYVNPTVTFSGKVETSDIVNPRYSIAKVGGGTVNSPLTVGTYNVTITGDSTSYLGSLVITVIINPDNIDILNDPTVNNLDDMVSYGKLLSEVTFASDGRVSSKTAKETVAGTFSLLPLANKGYTFTAVGTFSFKLVFTPSDTLNYAVVEKVVSLNVSKRDLSSYITLTFTKDFVYGELTTEVSIASFTNVVISFTTQPSSYSLSYAAGVIMPSNKTFNAGSYGVTVTVNDPLYRGTKTEILTVAKKAVTLVLDPEKTVPPTVGREYQTQTSDFSNKTQTVSVKVMDGVITLGETVSQVFYRKNAAGLWVERQSGSPSAIGMYRAELTLVSTNYKSEVINVFFVIRVDDTLISISNLTQTYGNPQTPAVSMGINAAVCTLTYESVSPSVTYQTLPTQAGTYKVFLTFIAELNNDYSDRFEFRTPLIINKATAKVLVNESTEIEYTGRSYSLSVSTDPYGLSVVREYLKEGTDVWTTEEVLTVGSHRIRFRINNVNYTAGPNGYTVQDYPYTIKKAKLSIVSHPEFGAYVYNSDVLPSKLLNGAVVFGSLPVAGEWTLNLSDIKTLGSGVHSVTYTFTASGELGENFELAYGKINLSILKKVLNASDVNVTLNGSEILEAGYNTLTHAVTASLVSNEIIYDQVNANNDFRFIVNYNGTLNVPRDVGTYSVRVLISSRNYEGAFDFGTLTISKGLPEIAVKPTVNKTFNLTTDKTIVSSNLNQNGVAVVAGLTSVQIAGTWTLTLVSTTFTTANINKVSVTFIPSDTSKFLNKDFTIDVNVIGDDPFKYASGVQSANGGVWTNIDLLSNVGGSGNVRVEILPRQGFDNVYGQTLSSFNVVFTGSSTAVAELNKFGVLSFVNASLLPSVGDIIDVVYTPIGTYGETYNIMYGKVAIVLQKAVIPLSDIEGELRLFAGKTVSDASFDAFINGVLSTSLFSDYTLSSSDTSINYLITSDAVVVYEDWFVNGAFVILSVRLTAQNYEDVTLLVPANVYKYLRESDINVTKFSKSYDGKAISALDLGLTEGSIGGTTEPVLPSAFFITILSGDPQGIAPDTYLIRITVRDINYYGEKDVTFTITKRDVSNEVSLSFNTVVFGSVSIPTLRLNNVDLPLSYYTLYFKLASATEYLMSGVLINAGAYKIKAVISAAEFSGVCELNFTITPRILYCDVLARIRVPYLDKVAPHFNFFLDAALETPFMTEYMIFYSSASYTESDIAPKNAGEYLARILLSDANYTLSQEQSRFILEITARLTTAYEAPQAAAIGENESGSYNLIYGQRLSELVLLGGKASHAGEDVEGYFAVAEPDRILNAGTHQAASSVVAVKFVPFDKNYAESVCYITVTVAKAEAKLIYNVLTSRYDGKSKRNEVLNGITVIPQGVQVEITFYYGSTAVLNPTDAGNYTITAVSLDSNYTVVVSSVDNQPVYPVLIITKAVMESFVRPAANSISVGDNLGKSSLEGGRAYYTGFTNAIDGRFSFVQTNAVYQTAGTFVVAFRFTPSSSNFAEFTGSTEIVVEKAKAKITVTNTTFTYASGFKMPTFTTSPSGLKVVHNIPWNEYDPTQIGYVVRAEDIIDVNTYYFSCWVEDENYSNRAEDRVEFTIVINKKRVDLDFINSNNGVTSQYVTTYGKGIDVRFRLYNANNTLGKSYYLLKDEKDFVGIKDGAGGLILNNMYDLVYQSASGERLGSMPPEDRGLYYVVVTLYHRNYEATRTAVYQVDRGIIEQVIFNEASLNGQIYGRVSEPIITTVPIKVAKPYIVYQGSTIMPKEAGSYNITVYFDDDNFDKKQVNAIFRINKATAKVINVKVEDKVFDGVATLKITGSLQDIRPGDECYITMTAATFNNAINVGFHSVVITSFSLGGNSSKNYDVTPPTYDYQVQIKEGEIKSIGGSIVSSTGFADGTEVFFTTINSPRNKTNIFTKAMGVESTMISFTVTENGIERLIGESFTVKILIPEKYRKGEFTLSFEGTTMTVSSNASGGSLKNAAGQTVIFERQGNYIVFTTSSPGTVVFTKKTFQYTFVVFVAAIAMICIGVLLVIVLVPRHRKRQTQSEEARKLAIRKIKKGY